MHSAFRNGQLALFITQFNRSDEGGQSLICIVRGAHLRFYFLQCQREFKSRQIKARIFQGFPAKYSVVRLGRE